MWQPVELNMDIGHPWKLAHRVCWQKKVLLGPNTFPFSLKREENNFGFLYGANVRVKKD